MWAALCSTRCLLLAAVTGGPRFDSRARHLAARLGGCEAAPGVGSARGRGENGRRGGGEEVLPPDRGVRVKPQAARRRLGRRGPRVDGRLRAAPHPQAYPARGHRPRSEAPASPRAQPAAAARSHAALGRHAEPRLGWPRTLTSSHGREVNAARWEPPRIQTGSPLPWSTLHWSTLPGSTLPWSTLPWSTLPWSTLPGSTLPGSTLPWSTLPWSTLPGSTLPWSTLPWSTLPGSTLPGSTLPRSTLPGSTFPGSTLPGSTLPGSTLPWSTLPWSTLPGSTLPAEACSTSRLGAPQLDLDRSPSPMDPDPRGLTPPRPDLHRGRPACQAAPPRPTAPRCGPRARASPWPSDGGRRLVASSAGRREEDKDGGGEETWGAALRAAVDAGPRAGPASAARGDGEGPGAEEAATELARCYTALGPAGRRALLRALARDPHGVDHEAAATLAARVAHLQGEGTRDPATLLQAEERLRQALAPRYKHLLVRLSRLEGGVKLLVDMRADALAAVAARDAADGPHLKELAMVLKALLSEWFSIGLLHLERVTWQSPCDMLQKIAQYEAVHPVRHWTDMRRRVGPYRRCFVFTHAAMPREPLVVLHVALTDTISSDIRSIVRESPTAATPAPAAIAAPPAPAGPAGIVAPSEDAGRVRAAVFYSISATQRGLQGIDLGHHLIKHVVRQLQAEFPSTLRDFSSLSPIPGFTRWLAGVLASHDPRPLTSAAPLPRSPSSDTEEDAAATLPPFLLPDEAAKLEALTGLPAISALRAALSRSHSCPDDSDEDGGGGVTTDGAGAAALDWWRRADLREAMRAPLTRLCARYLVGERRRGRALDPVAHFHLRNGAEAWRLNWMADTSPRALRASAGLMANYRYWPERTVRNAADYERHGRAPASADVATLAAAAGHDDASKL